MTLQIPGKSAPPEPGPPVASGADESRNAADPPATGQCPNCYVPLQGTFCHSCGQRQRSIRRLFWTLVNEAFEDVFTTESRVGRTLLALVTRPGRLTLEYWRGRREHYIPPVRLYLLTSVLFFFSVSILNTFGSLTVSEAPPGNDDGNWEETRADIAKVRLDWLSESANEALVARLQEQALRVHELVQQGPRAIVDEVLDIAPPVAFLLLPLFALLLKLLYLKSGRYYAEHLVLALHNHAFLFVTLFIGLLLDSAAGTSFEAPADWLDSALNLWVLIYLYLTLHRAYGDGWGKTFLKFQLLGFLYLQLFLIALLLALIWGVMTL